MSLGISSTRVAFISGWLLLLIVSGCSHGNNASPAGLVDGSVVCAPAVDPNYNPDAAYFYPPNTTDCDPNIAAREAALMARDTAYYAAMKGMDAGAAMTLLSAGWSGTNGPAGLADNTLGGVDASSPDALQREGAAQALQLALYHGFSNFLDAAVATIEEDIGIRIMQFRLWVAAQGGNPLEAGNGDVKPRVERGDIAWEAWLLNQAGKYFTAKPGAATCPQSRPTSLAQLTGATTQCLMEAFTADYVESCSLMGTACAVWPTTGYNQEVSQGMHPAYMIGIYGQSTFAQLYPSSYAGFFQFWNGMLMGQQGSYEPDNTPSYGNFNVSMVMKMGLALNLLNRPDGNTTPNAYISDSVDMPRVLDRFVAETMTNGNAVNYNKAISSWTGTYAFNSPEDSGPFNLKMGYTIFGNSAYLYSARKLEQFMITTGQLSATLLAPTELFPISIQHYDQLNVPSPPPTSQVTQMRISPSCYSGLLLCRAAPQNITALIPNKIKLQTGVTDSAPYVLISVAGAGHHANLDQRMTLENTTFNGAYITARIFRPCQVNQSNSVFIAPSNLTYPVWTPTVGDCDLAGPNPTWYAQMSLNPNTNNYILEDAGAYQLKNGSAYGELIYSQYEYPGYHATRQVTLLPNGIILVKDSVWSDGTSTVVTSANGGVTWRVWAGVTNSSTNWVLQAPVEALDSNQILPSSQATSTLFYMTNTTGRTFGNISEPLSNSYAGSPANQKINTFYAYDSLSDQKVHTFISAILPILDLDTAPQIANQIDVQMNTDGTSTITVPDRSGPIVTTF